MRTTAGCAKIQSSLADTRPAVAHDQVMADTEVIIRAAERKRAAIRS
ncbi:hypothetical protein [Paraburkholderia sp. MM5496-R1]